MTHPDKIYEQCDHKWIDIKKIERIVGVCGSPWTGQYFCKEFEIIQRCEKCNKINKIF